ncbi:hypothetical protein [Burkholderia vietnamiensis]|nr:hypothetical protein [Burkholderia vietnamiensis]
MKHLINDPSLWREAAFIGGEWISSSAHAPALPLRKKPSQRVPTMETE